MIPSEEPLSMRQSIGELATPPFDFFSGVIWVFLGVFGVGLLWMTATALTNGTASLATFLLALFGAVITVLAGDELFHRLLGGTPVF